MSRFGFAAININQVRNGRGVLKIKAATVMEASAGRKRGVRKEGSSLDGSVAPGTARPLITRIWF